MTQMRAYEKILRSRGHVPSSTKQPQASAFEDTGGYPQMGFSIHRKDGSVHGFLYHNLGNLEIRRSEKSGEYLSFTHRGKAVTIHGHNLSPIFDGMMQHTLRQVRELDPPEVAPSDNEPFVDRVAVTHVRDAGFQR